MASWHEATVEELCTEVTSGGTPSRKRDDFYADDGIPWVKSKELQGARITRTEEFITHAGLEGSSAKILPPDTVLMAMYGANVGKLGWLGIEATVNQAVCAMIADPKVTDSRFLYYALAGTRAKLIAQAHGAAQQNLSQQLIKPFVLRVPDIETQRQIGFLLRSIDDLIENNRRRVKLLEEMARTIYREWFVKFRYPGHEDVPLVDSALGPIPEGWSWSKLDDLVRVVKKTVEPSTLDPYVPAVGLEHIPRNQITLDNWGLAGEQGSRKTVFSKGDILFGKIRPYFHKVSLAPVDGISSTDAIVIRPLEHWGQVTMLISSKAFVAHATQTANGTKMPRADWKVLGQWPVAVPPAKLADNFSHLLHHLLELAATLMFVHRHAAQLRNLLLPKLVTGQIDVSTLNLDTLSSTISVDEGEVA